MRRYLSAFFVVGAIVFALDVSWGLDAPVGLSSAALTGSATDAALVPDEPFVNPFGTKMPKIVSGFGKRDVKDPLPAPTTGQMLKSEVHDGTDYAASVGTAVRAARSGKVIFAGFSKMYASRADKTQQHRFVIIRHVDGKSSRYVHLNNLHVRPGQDVTSGQILGVLAESDEWTQPVLHFEIRDAQGRPINPVTLITDVKKP